ncbi:MAG: DNA primase [Corynebacterium sp.]|nr:DNA primase [Corynebacterium sp.]
MGKGLIPQSDIEAIRERIAIEDVIGEYVELRPSGSSLVGLSPFKDERTPSFHVRPDQGFYYCFSTSQGGDVFKFLMEMEHVTFPEAVENCADRIGYEIHYEGGRPENRNEGPNRKRLLAANKAAHEFYRAQLETPEAQVARDFILARGFDRDLVYRFGLGYAPAGWDTLTKHLQRKGFSFPELEAAGLSTLGKRGPIDRFHRRILWPIFSVTGDVIGFGARKLFDDDKLGKYMNTPETPLYKKSKVLFGLDLARRSIAEKKQVIVVEGYTDVMAMHAAGFDNTVAACGTAFGNEHLAILRRYMTEDDFITGEIVYTFDGDAAGQKAARRAYEGKPEFAASSFVAVAPDDLDPCDLRLKRGDIALQNLVAHKVPMFEFIIRSLLQEYALDTVESRVQALRRVAPVVANIPDRAMQDAYMRRVADWIGWVGNSNDIARAVADARHQPQQRRRPNLQQSVSKPAPRQPQALPIPNARDHGLWAQRTCLKMALQYPQASAPYFDALDTTAFSHPMYGAIATAIEQQGGCQSAQPGPSWVQRILSQFSDVGAVQVCTELVMEPFDAEITPETAEQVAAQSFSRLQVQLVENQLADLRSQLARIGSQDPKAAVQIFEDMKALDAMRKDLIRRSLGS